MPLGPINQIAITTGPHAPPATHPRRLLPTFLTPTCKLLIIITHKPITVHTLALSKEEGEKEAHAPHDHNYYRQHIHPYSNH